MIIIIFSEVHRGTLIFTHKPEENLNSHASLESFKNKINNKMTFTQALNTISSVLRKRISSLELKSQSEVVNRYKYCEGKPVCRVSDIDYT